MPLGGPAETTVMKNMKARACREPREHGAWLNTMNGQCFNCTIEILHTTGILSIRVDVASGLRLAFAG